MAIDFEIDEQYSVTLDDVKAYLATKQEHEDIGMPCKGFNCLLARTLQWKYSGAEDIGVLEGNYYADIDDTYVPIPSEVRLAADKFDGFYHNDNTARLEVTKAQLREYMPELFS